MTEEHAKNYLYRICGCRPDYLFAEKVVEIIKNLGSTIEKKEKQIEKMKCCENCNHPYWNAETEAEETVCDNCVNNSNWELKK